MSSIYRKGRDGYFYYQTYSQDPLTKKKDKKIYHSLGTKERSVAEQKKLELDNFYKKEIQKPFFKSWNRVLINKISLLIIIIIFFIYFGYSIGSKSKKMDEFEENNKFDNSIIKSLPSNDNRQNEEAEKNIYDLTENTLKINKPSKKDSLKIIPNDIKKDIEIIRKIEFEYEINRIDLIDGPFKQGKIYVLVNQKYRDKEMIELCKIIRSDHSKFSNIIICVYLNSKNGIELSSGSGNNLTAKEISDSWLAMYSYNNVEGEYFDNNPAVYLGGF